MGEENGFQLESLLRHQSWMKPLARRLLCDEARADDAVQETLLAALERDGEEPRRVAGWLRRVLSNFALQARRRERRRRRREVLAARPEALSLGAQELLERAETEKLLADAVIRLREPYRSAVLFRYYQDLSPCEIAKRLGVPVATVKTRLRRALDLLREGLDRRGGDRAWRLGLLPLPALKSPWAFPVTLKLGGSIMGLALKPAAIAASLIVLALVVGGGLFTLFRAERSELSRGPGRAASAPEAIPATSPEAPRAELAEDSAGAPSSPAVLGAEAGGGEAARQAVAESESGRAAPAGAPGSGIPAAAGETSEVKSEYLRLKQIFASGLGGKHGWAALKDSISPIRELLSTDEGVAELLALFDGETDASFLEAILHHLPLNGGQGQEEIVADEDLHQELWRRFEDETETARRVAYLRFFSYQPKLAEKMMDRFLDLVTSEPDPRVRSQALDAIGSAGYPEKTWPALCQIAESDPEEALRALAVEGLGGANSERGEALVKAAFQSSSEKLRTAALRSAAGLNPPGEVTGPDLAGYLVSEFRAAATREYKLAILDRLGALSPATTKAEIQRAIEKEPDRVTRQAYRKVLEKL